MSSCSLRCSRRLVSHGSCRQSCRALCWGQSTNQPHPSEHQGLYPPDNLKCRGEVKCEVMSYGRPYRTLEGRTEGKLGRREREGHHYTSRRESHHQRLCADQVGEKEGRLTDSFRCAPPRTARPTSWEQPRFTKNAASTRVQATEGEQGRGRRGGDSTAANIGNQKSRGPPGPEF